jgi:hypothetical protein
MKSTPRLACEQCKRRKIRCNKGSPCSACKNADLQCHTVQRARLPRGKSGKSRVHNTQLEDRVARIESLLVRHAGAVAEPSSTLAFQTTTSTFSSHRAKGSASVSSPAVKVAHFVAPEFWAALSDEVQGLRETLEDAEDGDPNDNDCLIPDQSATDTSSTSAILFQQSKIDTVNRVGQVALHMRTKLLETFKTRVDSVYKILHWPSVLSSIRSSNNGPHEVSLTPSFDLLNTSIYFMATCTLTDDEARMIGLGARLDILQDYRSTLETLLAKSKLLTNPHLTELQAFVIYLVC